MFSSLPVRKCHPAARLRALVAIEVGLLLLRGEPRRLLRIDADRDDVELAADVER